MKLKVFCCNRNPIVIAYNSAALMVQDFINHQSAAFFIDDQNELQKIKNCEDYTKQNYSIKTNLQWLKWSKEKGGKNIKNLSDIQSQENDYCSNRKIFVHAIQFQNELDTSSLLTEQSIYQTETILQESYIIERFELASLSTTSNR